MSKKDIAELKRRFTKENCTITKLCGCYVDSRKDCIVKMSETFLNLESEEFYKYLDIAKKTLSGTIGNNLLSLPFPLSEEDAGGKQQFLLGLRSSGLKNSELLDRFYELVIENYEYEGNYLILLFHDAYDVITKATDQSKLDESEEVFEYLLCAICPVTLSSPALGYLKEENKIGPRIRDWIVSAPETGFLFPAFEDRSSDIHSVVYYTKNPKDSHPEFMEAGLGCETKRTAAEQKETFKSIVKRASGGDEDTAKEILLNIQENLAEYVEEQEEITEADTPILVTRDTVKSLMTKIDIPETVASQIEESYTEEFADAPPAAEHLIDAKAVAANLQKKKEFMLETEVKELKEQLQAKNEAAVAEEQLEEVDVVLKVRPQKVSMIKIREMDGKKCLVIPLEEDEHARVNGDELLPDAE